MKIRLSTLILICYIGFLFVSGNTLCWARGDRDVTDILNLSRLPHLKDAKSIQFSSSDSTGNNADYRIIKANDTLVLADVKGPGVFTQFWMTLGDTHFLRDLILQIYWDGEKDPSVQVPVGDFFGVGFSEYRQFSSYLLGMTSGGYYCYIPMPFAKSARVQIANLSGKPIGIYYHLDMDKLKYLERDMAYFHAQFRRENPTQPGKDYTILEAKGTGHYIGTVLSMQGPVPGTLWFLEGNEHIYIDGESQPSWSGTGTEDYFLSGYYFTEGPYYQQGIDGTFHSLFHGLTLKDPEQSRISAYRFHLQDAIPFTKSIKVSIEHGTGNTVKTDYSSVAYWYQTEPHEPFPLIEDRTPTVFKIYRIPNIIEAESLIPTAVVNGGKLQYQSTGYWSTDTGPFWSGVREALYLNTKQGNSVTFTIPVKKSGKYNLLCYFTKGPDYGSYQPVLDDNNLGDTFDGYNGTVIPAAPVSYGTLDLTAGNHELTFQISGKNAKSSGFTAAFDGFLLKKTE